METTNLNTEQLMVFIDACQEYMVHISVDKLGLNFEPPVKVIDMPVTMEGLSTPIQYQDAKFIGKGLTIGGAREFTMPNLPVPTDAKIVIVF